MKKKRLRRLSAFLKTIRPRDFDMETWRFGPDPEPKTCGTTGCALGWACTIPEFKEAGLKMYGGCPRYADGAGIHTDGYHAGAEFFGLTLAQSYHLFDPSAYEDEGAFTTPADVAKRIDSMLKRDK